ncbi:subtilase [Boeremia exigua]|uniref:subtilase n=1 Tax=Boeremia exigua TaxID=749465 RepID=UPI001E8E6EB4|nr:subtilase [Boeremia exigua]KAH6613169.1 subtilase [Boeremia exigua]
MVKSIQLLPLIASVAAALALGRNIPGSFIVEFEAEQDLLSYHSEVDPIADTVRTFNCSVFKGATIQFRDDKTAAQAAVQLKTLDSVKNIWPNRLYARPDFKLDSTAASVGSMRKVKRQRTNNTYSPHVQTQVDRLHAEGITGRDVKIAIIDSGIDYLHPALGGCLGLGCLVVEGYDLVGDNYTGRNTPVPDDDPMDCSGHGTHVAGIVAAQPNEYGFTGAAPGAKLSAYRVFGCDGGADTSVIIDAYMRAFEDGANIITASLGSRGGWDEDAWSTLLSRITKAGVPCPTSAGNDGDTGLFSSSVDSTAIASYVNTEFPAFVSSARLTSNGTSSSNITYIPGQPQAWAGVKLPLWALSFDTTVSDQGCNPFPDNTPDLSEKIVLIRRGGCTFAVKAENAAAKGARYVLIYNNASVGAFSLELSTDDILGVGMLFAETGINLINALAVGSELVLELGDPKALQLIVQQDTIAGGYVSDFTSWSPTWEAGIKPQFGAPGENILSTLPLSQGGYGIASGTSMSCPLVAGVYALVSNVRGTLDPEILDRIFSATANPNLLYDGSAVFPWLAPVAQQGSGMIQAWDAAHVTTIISRSNIAFNDTDYLVDTTNFTILNTGSESVTYDIGTVGAATAYTFSNSTIVDPFPGMGLDGAFAQVLLSESKVTVPSTGKAVISVTVIPPALEARRLPVYSGYITLNATNGESLSLPYQGIVGSLNSQDVLGSWELFANDTSEVPITTDGTSFIVPLLSNGSSNATYEETGPRIVVTFKFGSPYMRVEAISMDGSNSSAVVGDIFDSPSDWMARDEYWYPINGRLANESFLAPGRYKLRARALHVYGDRLSTDEKQWDEAESPVFSISYT